MPFTGMSAQEVESAVSTFKSLSLEFESMQRRLEGRMRQAHDNWRGGFDYYWFERKWDECRAILTKAVYRLQSMSDELRLQLNQQLDASLRPIDYNNIGPVGPQVVSGRTVATATSSALPRDSIILRTKSAFTANPQIVLGRGASWVAHAPEVKIVNFFFLQRALA